MMRNLSRLGLLAPLAVLMSTTLIHAQGATPPELARLGAVLAGTWEGETTAIQLTINPPARGAITALATSFEETMNGQFNGMGVVTITRDGGDIIFRERDFDHELSPAFHLSFGKGEPALPVFRLTRLTKEEAVFQNPDETSSTTTSSFTRHVLQIMGHDHLLVRSESMNGGKLVVRQWLFGRVSNPGEAENIRTEHQGDVARQYIAIRGGSEECRALIEEYQRRVTAAVDAAARVKLQIRLQDFDNKLATHPYLHMRVN